MSKKIINITNKNLPLYCPINKKLNIHMHPKVFLEIKKNKNTMCPYCGTKYTLIN